MYYGTNGKWGSMDGSIEMCHFKALCVIQVRDFLWIIHNYKFKFDRQPGSLTVQVAGEHQPSKKHP